MLLPSVDRTRGVYLFTLFVFILFTIPKANLRVGPIPVYLVDILVLSLLLAAPRRAPTSVRGNVRFANILSIILPLALVSELMGMVTS
ncbi:MAG: hypothetical protein AAGJ35_14635, partial [Myxococcota bacterium]